MSKSKASANRSILEHIFGKIQFFYSHEYCTIQIIFKFLIILYSWLKNWGDKRLLHMRNCGTWYSFTQSTVCYVYKLMLVQCLAV